MIKLYNCSAKCDFNTLQSYNTIVFQQIDNKFYMHAYRSNTTLSHIRKYIKWLRESGVNYIYSSTVATMYEMLIRNKKTYMVYDGNMGTVEYLGNDRTEALNAYNA